MAITGRSQTQPVYTTQKNNLLHSSVVDGEAYSWTNATTDLGANATILLVKNTSTTHNLHIDQIWCHSDTTTVIRVSVPKDGSGGEVTPDTGDVITGVCLNTAKDNTAAAICRENEGDNSIGHANSKIIWAGSIPADNSTPVLINSGLVLASLECVGVDQVANTGEAYVTIIGHYERA